MKELTNFIKEGGKFDLNLDCMRNERRIGLLNKAIKKLHKTKSIAGLNCWDLAWAFGEWVHNQCGQRPRVAIFGNGEHCCPIVVDYYRKKWLVDFTWTNQYKFEEPVFKFDKDTAQTRDGKKVTKIIFYDEIPKYFNEIELDSPKDLYSEFDEIAEKTDKASCYDAHFGGDYGKGKH